MAYRFDIMTIRRNDKCGIVIFTVGAQSRCAIVASACAQRGMVKVINLLACRGHKGQMKRSGFIIRLKKAKRNIAGTHFDTVVWCAFIDNVYAKRPQSFEEEGFTLSLTPNLTWSNI